MSASAPPFGAGVNDYDWLCFLPPDEAISWLLRGNEQRVVDLAAGPGQVTVRLISSGYSVVAIEPDRELRASFAARFPGQMCLNGTAERMPLPAESIDAVIVGSAWHWFDMPTALTEIARVLRSRGRLGVCATSVDIRVDWVRDMFTEEDLCAQERAVGSTRGVRLPSRHFSKVEETIFSTTETLDFANVVAWFTMHSVYRKADETTRRAMLDRAARVLRDAFPRESTVKMPLMTLCWRTVRLPR
jgi:ubiquinone/menaquinone biosynthesis C-methylase UbiE